MNRVQVLDCTLRDGGYCNEWQFGYENIKKIMSGLVEANIEIIECGFLTNQVEYCKDVTKFTTVDAIRSVIPENRDGKMFVAMVNYGEYNADELPKYDGNSIDGIRIAFHKNDITEALLLCKSIKDKGYRVFVQAMVSLSYSDVEFLDLIKQVNELEPYAFYIVDSFGMMKSKDLIRLFYMIEHNLNGSIWIGFHSHNNMQLAYSNAQSLLQVQTNRCIVIDSSVYGMGRGAGNLNTELFIEYLNDNYYKKYNIKPLLCIIDEILNEFYQRNYWGYSLPNYISASHSAHPNYAGFLDDKKTLTVADMNEIFDMMNEDKKVSYDKKYIENLYERYMVTGKVQEGHKNELKQSLLGKKVLLIAPGKSSADEKDNIRKFAMSEDVVVISVNFAYKEVKPKYIFLSNLRRFKTLEEADKEKCIITSNIPSDGIYLQTKYSELINNEEAVRDNAGLMAIKFLINYGVEHIFLAGFDGYSHNESENYGDSKLAFVTRNAVLDAMNEGMQNVIKEYAGAVDISFLTKEKHIYL